jgi:nucleobase:cation symporter-1, NCS1 family
MIMENQNSQNKIFTGFDQMSLWFSLGVGLLVMQMGSFLSGAIDVKSALLAIIIGSLLGSLILAGIAYLGQKNGYNSAQLITATYGTNFAKLPILLNIIQLLGWTAFEFVIMSEGVIAILQKTLNTNIDETALRMVFAVFFSGLVIYLLSKPMTGLVRKIISKIAMPLVILSLLWLSVQFINRLGSQGFANFLNQKGSGDMTFAGALDLVIAMPISWLPLVCDYSRFAKTTKGTIGGTFFGYAIANIWCYALGLLIAATPNPDANFVATILLAQGGLIALGLILFDELDNAYGDAYSGSVSIAELNPKFSERLGGKILVAFAGAAAAFLPMHDLEHFLIILSSVFIPLFAVILGYNLGRKAQITTAINPINSVLWILGIVLFQIISKFYPQIGASLPTFALCLSAAFVATRIKH